MRRNKVWLRGVVGEGSKKVQETEYGGLLVNTMPGMSVFSQCLLKANKTKYDQFRKINNDQKHYLCLTKVNSFRIGPPLKDACIS